MNLSAYWVANFVVDLLKMELVIVPSLIAFHVFDTGYDSAWMVFLGYPLAWIPFAYALSFNFSSLSSAQTFAMTFNFGFIVFGSTIVNAMRWISVWEV